MNNVMVDLETLDNTPTSVIIAIGAVAFDETGIGRTFYNVVSAKSCTDVGLTIGADTVMWWMKQDIKAKAAFGDGGIPLEQALFNFAVWYPEGAALWGNGATFDNVILANAYRAFSIAAPGIVKAKCPWKYNKDRCYRTLKALYPDIIAEMIGGVAHNALDDAAYQAKHAVKILRHIKGLGGAIGELRKLT